MLVILTKVGFVLGFLVKGVGRSDYSFKHLSPFMGRNRLVMSEEKFAHFCIPSARLSFVSSTDLDGLTDQQRTDLSALIRSRQSDLQKALQDCLDEFMTSSVEELGSYTPEQLESLRSNAAAEDNPISVLSGREQQVMELLALGKKRKTIAQELDIDVKTVDTHRGHVLKKLGLETVSELTIFALKHGYIAL